MKICLVCSHGGHLTETLQLLEAFEGHDFFFVTYRSSRDEALMEIARAYFIQNIGSSIWRMLKAIPWALGILLKEKPDVILSLGAEVAIPFFYLGKLLRARTIFIESWTRLRSLSGTDAERPIARSSVLRSGCRYGCARAEREHRARATPTSRAPWRGREA